MGDFIGQQPIGQPRIVDDGHAPEFFATEAMAFSGNAQMVTIALTSLRWDYSKSPPEQVRVVVGRVVMPTGGGLGLAVGLYQHLQQETLPAAPVIDHKATLKNLQ
jgi:hypothetical protein